MSQESMTQQPQSGQSAGGTASPALPPDINTQTFPFDTVLYNLNRTASFSIFTVPEAHRSQVSDPHDAFGINGGFLLNVSNVLHRFDSIVQPMTLDRGLRVSQAVGESAGMFRCRLVISPDDFRWAPGKEPRPVLFDPSLSQSFVMLDNTFMFGEDGFRGYATGRTFPMKAHGRQRLLVGAVGNIMEGVGKFKGLEGTYLFNGIITPTYGLLGSITLRVVDWDGNLRSDNEIASLTSIPNPDPEATYIVLHGQKRDSTQRTEYSFGPNGQIQGLDTPAQWRSAVYSFAEKGRGLRSNIEVRQIIGSLAATIKADIFGPAGTALSPGIFTTDELYTFVDKNGQTVGTITASVVSGVSFDLKFPALPGQPGLRFGGFGPILGGTGQFSGVQGMLTVNSLIGIMPHALSLMHVFRIIDPDRALQR